MSPIPVVVTAVGGGGLGEQLIKALRLAETPYRIIGADITPFSKGLMEVDQAALLPPAKDPQYLQRLLSLCEEHQAVALLCGSEVELKVLDKAREEIKRRGIFLPIQPSTVLEHCLDKARTSELLHSLGFAVPAYRAIRSLADLDDYSYLPAVVKPSTGGGGSANLYLAQTREELMFFGQHLLTLYDEFIVQEYVGTPDEEYTVGVLTDMNGELINSIAVRRHILGALSNRIKMSNRSGREELGPVLAISNGVSQGEIGRFPEVTGPCEKMALAVGSQGAINIQGRFFRGRMYVFEINPRFSGTTSLRALVGYNEPDILIRKHILGESIQPGFDYGCGVIVRGLAEVLVDPSRAEVPVVASAPPAGLQQLSKSVENGV